ncbi:hypothetical protein CS542_05200 [Pedobacter sp. IW39]|nr:hypothetical protein CS542_05200 [Pedobacter sp. IW39]
MIRNVPSCSQWRHHHKYIQGFSSSIGYIFNSLIMDNGKLFVCLFILRIFMVIMIMIKQVENSLPLSCKLNQITQ